MQAPFGPQTLFFTPTFRAHATSRQPRFTLMQVSFGPQTLFFISYQIFEFMLRPVDPDLLSCKCSSGPQTLFLIPRPVDPGSLSCKHPSAHKPYFSYQLFEFMLRPADPGLLSCKCPSAHKPYFSYQLFERMPRPIDPGSFPYKRSLNSNHPVHRTFLI